MPRSKNTSETAENTVEVDVQRDQPQEVAGAEGTEDQAVERDETEVFEQGVTGNTEAVNPFYVSNVDPTDPNGYNSAPRAAEGFIANPVAGGAIPADPDADVVNGITQSDPEADDLDESNVDPKGVIKKAEKAALAAAKKDDSEK